VSKAIFFGGTVSPRSGGHPDQADHPDDQADHGTGQVGQGGGGDIVG
jgi:hypothetical protein